MEELQDLGPILRTYAPEIDPKLVSTLNAIAESCRCISRHLWTADGDAKAGTINNYGDVQLDIDLYADQVIFGNFRKCGSVAIAASEEKPQELDMGGEGYSVGFDPLDGSSVIDANFAVGSIFGLWPGRGLLNRTGREQSASCMAVYGPRTTLAVALASSVTNGNSSSSSSSAAHPAAAAGVAFDLSLNPTTRKWTVARPSLRIAPSGKVFAPGNLRATADCADYAALFAHWVSSRYTLRYTGGMVPDVYHMFIKGKGVFSNVSSAAAPAKLRLVYECAPIALLVEAAGGATAMAPDVAADSGSASTAVSVLDVVIDHLDKRLGVCFGGTEEVEVFKRFMFHSSSNGGVI